MCTPSIMNRVRLSPHRNFYFFAVILGVFVATVTVCKRRRTRHGMTQDGGVEYLEALAVIAFDGSVSGGLRCHPDGVHIVYPTGDKICVRNLKTKKMHLLAGHTDAVSTLDLSPDGKYVGSGQTSDVGFKTRVILWDFEKRAMISSHELHKVRVASVAFSCDKLLMASLGGSDCGQLVVWHNAAGNACCATPAAKVTVGDAVVLKSLNKRSNSFVTGGNGNLRVWNIDPKTKTPSFVDVTMGKLKRNILSIVVDRNDEFAYCGTTSGDVVKISIGYPPDPEEVPLNIPMLKGCYAKCGAWKKKSQYPEVILYKSGVQCLLVLNDGSLVVGAGDGTLEIVQEIKWKTPLPKPKLYTPTEPNYKLVRGKKFKSAITSLQLTPPKGKSNDVIIMVGTKHCEIYTIDLRTFQETLIVTCHTSGVNSIAFPSDMSEVFATAAQGDIRIWCLKTSQELLRIQVADVVCSKVLFSHSGKFIISSWSDSCIRAFKPLSGQLIYSIINVHNDGITALAISKNGKTVISGGKEGQVRIWDVEPQKQELKMILKEHRGAVMDIKINSSDTEVISAGADGFCIIWDIIKMCRRLVFFAHALFTCVCYDPVDCQILTGGTDRRIGYREAGSGNLLRELEATNSGTINTIDIDHSGMFFISGGTDKLVKLWKYNQGIYTHVGVGHSGAVLSAAISPNRKFIVSTSASGSIFVWKFPSEYCDSTSAHSAASTVSDKRKSAQKGKTSRSISVGSSGRKDENISTINTARSGVITSLSCYCGKNNSGSVEKSKGCSNKCECKKTTSSTLNCVCTPPLEAKDVLF